MSTQERFKQMLDWLYANRNVKNQAYIALTAGINATTVSRILKGRVKSVKLETLRAVNAAYGNVFNPEWIRGDSDIMLAADVKPAESPAPSPTAAVPSGFPDGAGALDMSSLVNAALAAKDETIASLKRELDGKDVAIAMLREQLTERTTLMQSIQQQSADLSAKYEALLQEHSRLLHRINVKIDTINGSYLSIAAEPEGEYTIPTNKKRTPKD